MGVSSLIHANPIMGLIMIGLGGYSYFVKKHELDKSVIAKSGTVAGASAALFAVMGMHLLIEIVIVMVIAALLRKGVLDNERLMALVTQNLGGVKNRSVEVMTTLFNTLKDKTQQLAESAIKKAS
jgi:siderophore synthetase component